ncbi:MAG TPA: hypothetical protein VLA23_10210 [Candidatus Limnocylindrales bacterium]|nr:hypothetical protein [Candidatus Limnocylindrales bacterium]
MIDQAPHHPRVTALPSTIAGRWSILLAIVSMAALAVFFLVGRPDADPVIGALMLGSILTTAAAGVASLVAGVVALLRSGERGLLLALPILWGLVVTSFALGELLMPH